LNYQNEEYPEKELDGYWQLPEVPTDIAYESFSTQRLPQTERRKEYTALLGVSAAAAEDGTICFLQHTANVRTMLGEAQRLILIVPIDKIVPTREDAIFHARCMGAFGLESVLLDLKLPDQPHEATELIDLELTLSPPEIHIILLDNHRSEVMEDNKFADLFTCISCRACAKHCPTHFHFNCELGNYPKQYLWSYLLGTNQSLDMCIGCGMCYQECPLDIDIPNMIQVAKNQSRSGFRSSIGNRLLQDAWPLMRGASLTAPITNFTLNNRYARALIEKWFGFQRDAWVPPAQWTTLSQWLRKRDRLKK
jgi:L-lactate utilization protein LutB